MMMIGHCYHYLLYSAVTCVYKIKTQFTAAAYFSVCSSVGVGVASFSSDGFGLGDFTGLKTKEKSRGKNPIFT